MEYALVIVGTAVAVLGTAFVLRTLVTNAFADQASRICDPSICAASSGGGGGGPALTVTSIAVTSPPVVTVTDTRGGQVDLSAVVTPGTCAGRVDFTDTSVTPRVTLPSSVVTGGQAAMSTFLTVGEHVISAVFAPTEDSGCASSSTTTTVTVTAATPELRLTGPTTATATAASATVTVTGTFLPGLCPGSVSITRAGTTLGTVTLDGSGFFSVPGITLPIGSHALVGTYSPSGTLCGATTSNTLTVTVTDVGIPTPPGAPTVTKVTKVGGNGNCKDTTCDVALTWAASTDNVMVTRYQVAQATATAPTTWSDWTTVNGIGASAAASTVVAPSATGSFWFRVRACDAAGNCSAWTPSAAASSIS